MSNITESIYAAIERYCAPWAEARPHYVREYDPRGQAHLVIDNNDFANPRILEGDQ